MKRIILTLALCIALTGCYTQRFSINSRVVASEPTHTEMKLFLLWGLALQPQYTDPAQICGGLNNVLTVETKTTFLDGLVSFFTGGIISPQTSNVYCAGHVGTYPQYQQMPTSFVYPNAQNQGYQPQNQGQYGYPNYQQQK